ncbi:uncharacterized protein LOC127622664 [Xyrauchen texanus]|uniref:uncharacterized protein LOC127622664 n=1 Tax=Xyrauchen texanus TaxID=154827 RepID=UPI0022429F1A|nr:uncharacterized protein LOC127622664 [Xyrauchen texanus]
MSVVKDYTKPREYTGELIGIEYLYSQTGRVLQDVSLDPDIPDAGGDVPQLVEDDELADGQQEVEDLTLHVPGEFPAPQTDPRSGRPADAPEPSSPTGAPEPAPHSPGRSSPEPQQAAEDYRGPDDQPGYLAVVQLATALVGLRHDPALSEGRIDELIRLYEALSPYDRARVVYPPCYRDRPAQGRFMAAKPSRTSIPGVESLRRCLVGETSGPASCPSASRLVEAVCTQLCRLIPSGSRARGARRSRWDSILLRYQHIRDLVLGHQRLMARAPIQLFELNARTLSLWFTRTQREKERTVLASGGAAEGQPPAAAGSATAPCPAAAVDRSPAAATGQARTAAPRAAGPLAAAPAVAAPVPVLPAPVRPLGPLTPAPSAVVLAIPPAAAAATGPFPATQLLFLDLSLPQQSVRVLPIPTLPRTTPAPHVLLLPLAAAHHAGPQAAAPAPPPQPRSAYKTEWLRRKKAEQRAAAGAVVAARAGVPQEQKCRRCGQPKRRETGHTRYGNVHFCSAAAAGKSVEDWLREMKDQGRAPD